MEAILKEVVEFKDYDCHTENPFTSTDGYFLVSPRLFSALPGLPACAREILRFISLNAKGGKVYMPVTSLLVNSKVKSELLVETGIEALLECGFIKRQGGDGYWVDMGT